MNILVKWTLQDVKMTIYKTTREKCETLISRWRDRKDRNRVHVETISSSWKKRRIWLSLLIVIIYIFMIYLTIKYENLTISHKW